MAKELSVEQITELLAEPFDPIDDIEWRVQRAGAKQNGQKWAMVLAYVTNRAIMERLDAVFGIAGWENIFEPLNDGGMLCGLSCKIEGDWVTKFDGADKTAIEATKGGISSAMKRAGVQWGIGRYLYNLENTFVDLQEGRGGDDQITTQVKINNQNYLVNFNRPNMPRWALPSSMQENK